MANLRARAAPQPKAQSASSTRTTRPVPKKKTTTARAPASRANTTSRGRPATGNASASATRQSTRRGNSRPSQNSTFGRTPITVVGARSSRRVGRPKAVKMPLAEAEVIFMRIFQRDRDFKNYLELRSQVHWSYMEIKEWFDRNRAAGTSSAPPGNLEAPAPEDIEHEQEQVEEDQHNPERDEQNEEDIMDHDGANEPEQIPEVAPSAVVAPDAAPEAVDAPAPANDAPRVPANVDEAGGPIPGGVAPQEAAPGAGAPVAPRIPGPSGVQAPPAMAQAPGAQTGPAPHFQLRTPKAEAVDPNAPSTSAAPLQIAEIKPEMPQPATVPWVKEAIHMIIPADRARQLGEDPEDLVGFPEIDHGYKSILKIFRVKINKDLEEVILPFNFAVDYTSWTKKEFCQFLIQFVAEEKVKGIYRFLNIQHIKEVDMWNKRRLDLVRKVNREIPEEQKITEAEFLEIGKQVKKIRDFNEKFE